MLWCCVCLLAEARLAAAESYMTKAALHALEAATRAAAGRADAVSKAAAYATGAADGTSAVAAAEEAADSQQPADGQEAVAAAADGAAQAAEVPATADGNADASAKDAAAAMADGVAGDGGSSEDLDALAAALLPVSIAVLVRQARDAFVGRDECLKVM